MTPAELARETPRLFHLTTPDVVDAIRAHGLQCSASLVASSTLSAREQAELLRQRRDGEVALNLRDGREVRLNDNLPLSMKALAACLDDGWQPGDWIEHLNRHVFFWPSETRLQSLLAARMNRERERAVLVFDTLPLVSAHAHRTHLSPINSGATLRRAARRGARTFTPIGALSLSQWRRLRGMRQADTVAEVVVSGDVADASAHLLEVRHYRGTRRLTSG
jgi:hypothetical protein